MDGVESERWRGRRVLVTGGGFLGASVVEQLLAGGAEVIGLVGNRAAAGAFARHRLAGRVHIVHGRADNLFRVHSALAVHEVQAAFHFPDASDFERGFTTLLEAVRRYDSRVPVVVPRTGGSLSLLTSPAPLGLARFGELFGPDPEARGTVSAAILTHEPDTIDRSPRDFVHVKDAARACLLLAESLSKHPVPHVQEATFRSGWQFSAREIAALIREAMAGRPPLVPRAALPENPLGWTPSLNFASALTDTVEWYRGRNPGLRPDRARIAA